jgi:hypothetical protein
MSNKNDVSPDGDVKHKLKFSCTPLELKQVDKFRFKNEFPTRAQAVRALIELGLEYSELLEQQKLVGVLYPDKALEDENR